jgi:nicotinate-nucleotide adenylyltransferase
LKEKYPNHDFSLIMGSDNISSINKWKNYEMILNHYKIMIYQRAGTTESKYHSHKNVIIIDNVPILDLSATQIRTLIKENKSIRYLVPDSVYEYINTNKYYTK